MDYSRMNNEELELMIEQKDLEATCEMAERCLNGTDGVEMNLNRAYQLYHRAEAQGSLRAYEGLGYMYEHGILFGQNLNLAKEYYEKAGIVKTEFAPEQVRLTNQERVAAAIAKAETVKNVKVSSIGDVSEQEPQSSSSVVETAASLEPEAAPEPEYTPEPEFISRPEEAPEPEYTPEPEFISRPEEAPEPEYTPEPEFISRPEVTPEPEYTPDPVSPMVASYDADQTAQAPALDQAVAEAVQLAYAKAQEAAAKAQEAAVKAQEAAVKAQEAAVKAQEAATLAAETAESAESVAEYAQKACQ